MRPHDPAARLEAIRKAVSARVLESFSGLMQTHSAIGPEIDDLTDIASELLVGGKRLRAAFALAGWIAYGGNDSDPRAIAVGAGLELFQMAALVHDDVIDSSQTRRGQPAAHVQLAARHRDLGMVSEPRHFGTSAAILLGDLLLVAALREIDHGLDGLDDAARRRARTVVSDMMAEVTLGQYLDIFAQSVRWAKDPAIDVDRAQRVLRAKAARYSVELPLCLGATMAGAENLALKTCAQIGLPLGEAFQLRDDLLGVFGDPQLTGKPAGDDIREGKRTVLVTSTLQCASAADANALRSILGTAHADESAVDRARSIIAETEAPQKIEEMIARRHDQGLAAIGRAQLPPGADTLLRFLADAVVTRST